jgi:GH24 family phage-related lysozyme (muramidase)
MKKKQARDMATEALAKFEGYDSGVYKDIKGIDTAGFGFNLDAPETRGILAASGYDPEDIRSGKVILDKDQAIDIKKQLIDINQRAIEKEFGDYGLSDNEIAALTSLRYNSPKLIGPNLTKYIQSGDKESAAREILVRSNKEKNAGLAKRRLEEAELFTGGKLPELNIAESEELRNIFKDRPDTLDKRKLLAQYPFLNPSTTPPSGYPYFKIKNNLTAQVPNVVPDLTQEYISPSDSFESQPVDVTNELDKYDLLKRFKNNAPK